MIVKNENGKEIDFAVAVQYMDDEIRERVHAEFAPCSEQEFFAAYEKTHAAQYGTWELSKANPIY